MLCAAPASSVLLCFLMCNNHVCRDLSFGLKLERFLFCDLQPEVSWPTRSQTAWHSGLADRRFGSESSSCYQLAL